jgi:Rrf2 family iron-sulfur cluster assembly transcriptional regulator
VKVTTRGRYGWRAMLEIACTQTDTPMQMTQIAKSQDISIKYLHSILSSLKSANLVRAVPGRNGGFFLARPVNEISLLDILEAVEGPMHYTHCLDREQECDRKNCCDSKKMWEDLEKKTQSLCKEIMLSAYLKSPKTDN